MLLFGTRPPKATDGARKVRPLQTVLDGVPGVEFLILGGLLLLQLILVWA